MGSDFITINPAAANALARKSSAAMVAKITLETAAHARMIAPGTMKSKIRPIITGRGSPLGIVMVDHPAALFVLKGTQPHDIFPRNKAMLRFMPKGSNKYVFARKVHHPGYKGDNFLWKAMMQAKAL